MNFSLKKKTLKKSGKKFESADSDEEETRPVSQKQVVISETISYDDILESKKKSSKKEKISDVMERRRQIKDEKQARDLVLKTKRSKDERRADDTVFETSAFKKQQEDLKKIEAKLEEQEKQAKTGQQKGIRKLYMKFLNEGDESDGSDSSEGVANEPIVSEKMAEQESSTKKSGLKRKLPVDISESVDTSDDSDSEISESDLGTGLNLHKNEQTTSNNGDKSENDEIERKVEYLTQLFSSTLTEKDIEKARQKYYTRKTEMGSV